MARSIYPSIELGKLITAQVKRQNMPLEILAERATAPMDLLPPALSGEGKRSPWQFYERIFKALESDRSITQQARRYWEMWRDGESGRQSWSENNRVHRLRPDLPGYDLQLNPMRASAKEEFLAVMREFHVWAGVLIRRFRVRAPGALPLHLRVHPPLDRRIKRWVIAGSRLGQTDTTRRSAQRGSRFMG
jgi:hypothetical protein